MKKVLRFLALAMLIAMTGTNFEVRAKAPKKSCSGQARFNCNGSCEWRHGKCRNKVDNSSSNGLNPAVTNEDVPQGSPIIINNSNTPPNAANIIFYDTNKKAITASTTIWFGGQYAMIPANAAFIDVSYVASNANNDVIKVVAMQPITPSGTYSLTNPNSSAQPDDSPASWDITTAAQSSNPDNGGSINTVMPAIQSLQMQPFAPADQFAGQGLVGQFYNNGTATISDPTGVNTQAYSFSNVVSQDPNLQALLPANLTLIGSWTSTGMCPATGCVGPRALYFYGTLVPPASNSQVASYQTFNPQGQFAGSGLVGHYYNDGTAKIIDPSGVNTQVYSFNNVQSGGITAPVGLTLIGKTTSNGVCNGPVCSMAIRVTNIYGSIVPNNA